MSLPVNSKWHIYRSGAFDNKIQITSSDGTNFEAKYIETENSSRFYGEIGVRERRLINLRQYDSTSGYVAFHIGIQIGEENKYEGKWYDNGVTEGEFSLEEL